MNEENVSVKISTPLIDDIELQRIDTFYNDIVSEYTKAFVKEKKQVIVQRLMMNLQQENARFKDKFKDLEEWLEAMVEMYENEYKDIDASEHYKCMLHKLKEN